MYNIGKQFITFNKDITIFKPFVTDISLESGTSICLVTVTEMSVFVCLLRDPSGAFVLPNVKWCSCQCEVWKCEPDLRNINDGIVAE